jgi:hypothetical protein
VKKLSGILNLELAWRRLKNDFFNDFIHDLIELKDVEFDIKETLRNIRIKIDDGYQPSNLLRIDQPKSGFTLRPGSTMVPEDRIVYQAIIDNISYQAEEPPKEACYSYRISKVRYGPRLFRFWRNLWLEMRKSLREIYKEGIYCCLLRTDIASYFEYIDVRILRAQILDGEVKNKEVVDLLEKLLKKWAVSETKHLGIPQGCDASSYLGNLYLRDVDKNMLRANFKYFRYSDEIYILTKDKREARKAIKFLTHELRNLHLNLQEAKTKIGNEEEDKIKSFDYEFKIKMKRTKITKVPTEVLNRYKQITKNGRAHKIDISKFKWCINKLIAIKNDLAVNYLLNRLVDFPLLSDVTFSYLSLFANRNSIKDKILTFLSSEDNFYEWQEMWLLLILSRCKKLNDEQLGVLRAIAVNKEKHWASRATAMFVLGKLGDSADKKRLKIQYGEEEHPYIKRAIVIGLYNYSKTARNKFYSEIENDSYETKRLVNYLKRPNVATI